MGPHRIEPYLNLSTQSVRLRLAALNEALIKTLDLVVFPLLVLRWQIDAFRPLFLTNLGLGRLVILATSNIVHGPIVAFVPRPLMAIQRA